MRIAGVVQRYLIAFVADVRNAYQRPAVMEALCRPVTDGVAEFMAEDRGINVIVFVVDLSDRARLEKAVSFIFRALCKCRAGNNGMFFSIA